jgi:hypothetical protein
MKQAPSRAVDRETTMQSLTLLNLCANELLLQVGNLGLGLERNSRELNALLKRLIVRHDVCVVGID